LELWLDASARWGCGRQYAALRRSRQFCLGKQRR
jgi:hypothetical protein